MNSHPRAAKLALLLAVAPSLGVLESAAQTKPAGKQPAPAPAASAPAEKTPNLGAAALRPATSEPAAAAEETTDAAAHESSAMEPPLPTEGPPDPPPLDKALGRNPLDDGPPAGRAELVNLMMIRALVKKGIFTEAEAMGMVQAATVEADAALAEAKAAWKREIEEKADVIEVNEVPIAVQNRIRDQTTQQVLAEMRGRADGKNPRNIAIKDDDETGLFGDVRLRYEMIEFDADNTPGVFPNFNAINTGSPFNTAGTDFSPQYNVKEDRERYRLRFRVGDEFKLDSGWHAGFRIATGENNSPTTTNQSLGFANQGQGGNFSKYAIWLDRAYMRWDHEWDNQTSVSLWAGRFDNPFFNTEIIFDEDVGMDGLAVKLKPNFGGKVKPFFTAGAFPVFNTDLNFSSNRPDKYGSTDKYLFAVQGGADFKLAKDLTAKVSAGYYIFDGVEGKLSTPYTPLTASDGGDTDNTRPSFAQRGNTYRPLRQIIPDATNGFGTTNQWQYYGLASSFRPIAITGKLDWDHFEPVRLTAFGEFIKNTGFDRGDISSIAVNNRGPVGTGGTTGAFEGGDTAWILGLKVGSPAMDKKGAWQAGFNYRHVESDAVVDGFADSEFGGGGTNVQGWTVGGTYGLSKSAALGLSWLSSEQIAGPPLQSDYFQLDLKIKF